jgi:glycerol-3-phosphate acyltransferase PlsX
MRPQIRVAVDAMGGDRGPAEVVRGVIEVAQRESFQLILVGKPDAIEPELQKAGAAGKRIEFVAASEVVEMDDQPTVAIKRKRDASVNVGARLVRDGRADALVTIGNTGAAMAVALLTMGRIKGIDRPAIAAPLPTMGGGVVLLLDAGATVDCDPNNLYEFAVMGSAYAENALGIAKPRVALLSNGEETSKGNDLVKRTHHLFGQALADNPPFHFVGNVEGRDVFRDTVDVVVCDGFIGNVFLKTSEGVAEMILRLIRNELNGAAWTRALALPLRPRLRGLAKRIDYSERGGAPMLGINGLCIIGHGRSDANAVANACRVAAHAANQNVIEIIRQRICASPSPPPTA